MMRLSKVDDSPAGEQSTSQPRKRERLSVFREGINSMRKSIALRGRSDTDSVVQNRAITPTSTDSSDPFADQHGLPQFDGPNNVPASGNSSSKHLHVDLDGSGQSVTQENAKPTSVPFDASKEQSVIFENNKIAIAVDVSSSTRGTIIREELSTIKAISEGINSEAAPLAKVLPWDEKAWRPHSLNQVHSLFCGHGTNPSSLLRDTSIESIESTFILKNSSLWFLLTDGEIGTSEISRFASRLSDNGVHGTPCVIIVFGRERPTHPNLCEISVGVSIFAIAPDCIFLFHDVASRGVYVLQYKGCFGSLIPKDSGEILLDDATTWESLPRIAYSDLFQLKIPILDPLSKDEMILQSRRRIKLEDLYQGRLSPIEVEEVFQNDDNLKSLLLTTVTRGRGERMKTWMANQQDDMEDLVTCPRPDIENKASSLVQKLLDLPDEENADTDLDPLGNEIRVALRQAHRDNWSAFAGVVQLRQVQAEKRRVKVQHATKKLAEIETDHCSSARSVGSISGRERCGPDVREDHSSPVLYLSKLLYSQGYRNNYHFPPVSGRCQLCRDYSKKLALLLRRPPEGPFTEGFPQAESQTKVLFPLSMANFRETDILSHTICCDPCSAILVRNRASIKGDSVVGALPLMLWFSDHINKETWYQTVNTAFQDRFDRSDLPLIFLAVLYDARDKQLALELATSKFTLSTIDWACKWMASYIDIPFSLDNLKRTDSVFHVVAHHVKNLSTSGKLLLRHPVDSFVLLLRIAFPEELLEASSVVTIHENEKVTIMIFHRLLLELLENHLSYQERESETKAHHLLSSLIQKATMSQEGSASSTKELTLPKDNSVNPALTGFLSLLQDSYLLDSDTLRCFQKLGYLFSPIEWSFGPALGLFLLKVLHADLQGLEPFLAYDKLSRQPDLEKILYAPQDITPAGFIHQIHGHEL